MSSTAELRNMLGQCFFIGFSGLELPNSVGAFIKDNSIGGVSLFANNYESPTQVAALINQLQNIALSQDKLPLAIAVDHEGGTVQRFKKPFTHFPEARAIGDHDSSKLAFDCAQVMARELNAVGVNVIYAPVADIHTNSKNPVIGRRAFGEDEATVSKMVSAAIRGFLKEKVQPVVKHFPGHGDTSEDSHFHLPKVSSTAEILFKRELVPFARAFKSGCEIVMTAHIIVESIEPGLPATLSSKILQNLLREQLKYKGLIISDDMEMKAITNHFGEVDAAIMALEAGCDILLYHTEPVSLRVFEELLRKLTTPQGVKARNALAEAYNRVQTFKHKHFLPYTPAVLENIKNVIGCLKHQEIFRKV